MKLSLTVCLVGLVCAHAIFAQEALPDGASDTLSPASVERYFDQQLKPVIDNQEIIGAMVAVVRGDKPLLVKGYGITDITNLENPRRVDPNTTLFRTASVTKMFVALTAMQMIEEGKLDLDGDVNRYLKTFQAPVLGDGPLTIRHLLSHQGGYDTDISDVLVPVDSQARNTAAQKAGGLLPIFPPGVVTVYDNYGVGLLAMVMEEVEGKTLRELMHDRVLAPLGMESSVVGLPDGRRQNLQKCHEISDDQWQRCETPLMRDAIRGAGDLSVTAADMAKFLTAMLNQSRYAGGRILSEEGFADYVNADLNRNHPLLAGIGRLTLEMPPVGGGRFGHAGDLPGYASSLMVSPADNLAVYVAVNGHAPWRDHLMEWIVDESEKQQQATQIARKATMWAWLFLQQYSERTDALERPLDYPEANRLIPFTEQEIAQLSGRYAPLRDRTTQHLSVRVLNSLRGGVVVDFAADGSFSLDGNGHHTQQVPRLFVDQESGRRWTFLSASEMTLLAGAKGSEHIKLAWHQRPWVNIWPGFVVSILLFMGVAWIVIRPRNSGEQKAASAMLVAILLLVTGISLEFNFGRFLVMSDLSAALPHVWRSGLAALSIVFLALPLVAGFWPPLAARRPTWLVLSLLSIGVAGWQFYWDMAI